MAHDACVTEHAEVLDRPDLRWDAGVPAPVLLSDEHQTLLAFARSLSPVDLSKSQDDDGEFVVRVAEFAGCTSVRFGAPGDETFGYLPLYEHGLALYAVHEVHDSTWLAELRAVQVQHPRSQIKPYAESHHYLLGFHDSTLEAIARGIEVRGDFRTTADALAWMTSCVGGA
jgi:hypothetical protein